MIFDDKKPTTLSPLKVTYTTMNTQNHTPPLKFVKSLTPEKFVPPNFTGNTSEPLAPINRELISSSIDMFSHFQLPFPHLKFCLYQVQTETFQLTLHRPGEKWVVLPSLQTYQRERFPKDIQLFWQSALTVQCGEKEREKWNARCGHRNKAYITSLWVC